MNRVPFVAEKHPQGVRQSEQKESCAHKAAADATASKKSKIKNQIKMNETKNIKQKLMEVQKKFRTFAVEEESAKKNEAGGAKYKYTPGWKIVESIRTELDSLNIMLTLNNVKINNVPITYPVYKDYGGHIVKLDKTEILTTVEGDYIFEDISTGEISGPYHYAATGANGTDKSCASAYSLLERYFLLKHFHITTREKDEEPDAHDSDIIPGMERYNAPNSRTDYNGYAQQPAPACPQYPAYGQQETVQQPAYQPQPQYAKPAPQQQRGQYPVHQPMNHAAPAPAGTAQMAAKYTGIPDIENVINRLANFDRGTETAMKEMNEALKRLAGEGYTCTSDRVFCEYIAEAAQARREGRAPNFN